MATKTKPAASRTVRIATDDCILAHVVLRERLRRYEDDPRILVNPLSHEYYLEHVAAHDRLAAALGLSQRWDVQFPSVLSAERGSDGERE